jgi:hypothetical protein
MSTHHALFTQPIITKGLRPPKEWPERPGFWIRRKAGQVVMAFVSLGDRVNHDLPWHFPRWQTKLENLEVSAHGDASLSGWLSCLTDDDLAQALWRAST